MTTPEPDSIDLSSLSDELLAQMVAMSVGRLRHALQDELDKRTP